MTTSKSDQIALSAAEAQVAATLTTIVHAGNNPTPKSVVHTYREVLKELREGGVFARAP